MRLGFVFDTRFRKYLDSYYSVNLSSQMLSDRYLSIFDDMVVVGRAREVSESPQGKLVQCNGEHIQFSCIEDRSPMSRILHFREDSRKIREVLSECDAVICRGWRGTSICRQLNKPYLVEVVNCAWDSYWNHGLLGKLVAPIMYMIRRVSTQKAPYVLYVTNSFLQRRYPTSGKAIGVSDVALQAGTSDDILAKRLEKISNQGPTDTIRIGTAAAVDVPFKGQRFVIRALAKLKEQGLTNFEYQIAGGGSNQKLKDLAEKLGVEDQIVFKGSIVHSEMFAWYDSLDLYIQPSLQEGLPRAMVEAMSRGLPCYGSKTGGIPELIDPACVCSSNYRLADKFAQFLKGHTKEKAMAMAEQNYEEAKRYAADVLYSRRSEFFEHFASSVTGGANEGDKTV